jgi:tRNA-2-methylthio-N6-dimethylallyladenosine synthase
MKTKFFIKTFGCQMNKNDSLIVARILEDYGFVRSYKHDDADIYIINTCTVRAHAENRALSYISGMRSWRQDGERVLAVIGCLAEEKADDISKRLRFVDLILGPDAYRKIGHYVAEIQQKNNRIIDTALGDETYRGIYSRTSQVAGFLSIMRGCSNYCSYCIVPYVRGKARSRDPEDICKEAAHLVRGGMKDITLLGQNVNEYHYHDMDFAGILERVAQTKGLYRLRFLTSHPKDFDKTIVRIVKDHENICEWFHLPLQSGANRVLRLMNRHYTREDYITLIEYIRNEIPEASITTDLIVGFPSETEGEFHETLALIQELRFDNVYTYRYSPRPGTKANQLPQLQESKIKRRLRELIEIQNTITEQKVSAMKGKSYEILIEGTARGNASRGKIRGNIDVVVDRKLDTGAVVNVIIKEVRGRTPIGEPLHSRNATAGNHKTQTTNSIQ